MSTIPTEPARVSRRHIVAAVLCWLTVALEGFDLVALGAVIPTLGKTHHLGMDTAALTFAATISLVGVGLGAAGIGPLADRLGRRVALVASVAVFSVFTLLLPLAGSAAMFSTFRFVAGLGLGACMPTALTIMSEVTPARHRAKSATLTMTGYHVGAVLTSLLAIAAGANWHTLFYAGGALGLIVLPIVWFAVPESSEVAADHEAERKVPLSAVLRHPYRRASIGTWVGSFMGLLLVYGLNTWLPKIMNGAGYSLSSSLTMLLVMNVGAVVGLLLAGFVADRRGIKPSILAWYVVSAVLLALLSVRMENELLLDVALFATGVFVFSAQVLIYALVAHLFLPDVRGTALGLSAGVGRLGAIVGPAVTGALVAGGLAHPWGFYFFAIVAALAVVAVALVPGHIDRSDVRA